FNNLLIEQDKRSPHSYFNDDFAFGVGGGSIADIGTAEGIWALDNVENADKVYLFECDIEWIDALKKTFAPWKYKVVIVNKYIADITDDNKIKIDDFFKDKEINFIKADIEGAEIQLLKGAKETLAKQNDLKLCLCAYHNQNDEQELRYMLERNGYIVKNSKGYVFFPFGNDCALPHLRRGVIFAKKG
ncbi:MAG: FkbM family methyltransferase, partial [Endomicrobium sp.]|nr:FkbM family methyltransferase [Endomicrobium sp.]